NTTPAAEFNIAADPEAAAIVFTAGWPLTMVGLDLTHQALATPAAVERIAALGPPVPRLAVQRMGFFRRTYRRPSGCASPPGPAPARTHVCIASNSEGGAPHTFNQLAADGARGAGAGVQVVASRTPSDYLGSLQRCVASKPDLVIAISPDMATAVWRAAQLH